MYSSLLLLESTKPVSQAERTTRRQLSSWKFCSNKLPKVRHLLKSNQHLLNLFDELADITEEDYWKRQTDVSRAGGASSQAYEFSKLVKNDPQRFLRIVPQLQPQRHERYAGNAIRELAETDFPTNTLIQLVQSLEERGFVSEDFRSDAASALDKIAEGNQGLPQSVLSLLENWLTTHSKPDLAHSRSEQKNSQNLELAIIFDYGGGSHILPSGRGSIIRAIATGYLQQNPPDLQNWARVIQSRLGVEPHPAVCRKLRESDRCLRNGITSFHS